MLYQTENPHGGDRYGQPVTLDFSANTNPLGTPESVRQAVIDCVQQLDHYPDPYCRQLCQAIADYEGVPVSYILCGNGAAELIYAFCAARRPRRAMELAPTFSEYSAALEQVGCEVVRYALSPQRGFRLEEGILTALEGEKPDVLFLCNPNNPTGALIPPQLMEQIAALCQTQSITLFVDECFLDLTDGADTLSLKSRLAHMPGLFLLKAFTKSFGMAGLRLGYGLCANQALLSAMGRSVQPWNVSLPAQMAGAAALGERDFLRRAREVIRTQRTWLTEALEGLGMAVCPSQTNYLLFYSKIPLEEGLLARGIRIRPCENYPGLTRGWYRIAVRLPGENRQLIDALRALNEEEK